MLATRKLSQFRCAICRRRLPQDQWVYSRHTGNRYCLPGVKCEPKPKKESE